MTYLRRYRLIYLASPYSKTGNLDRACREVSQLALELMKSEICVAVPVAQGHTIAMLGGHDPMDAPFWMKQNDALQRSCDALLIAKFPGWEESEGISAEIALAALIDQPVYGLDPETMRLTKWGFG